NTSLRNVSLDIIQETKPLTVSDLTWEDLCCKGKIKSKW
ncbi:unnamed protein product, partial [Allacma fusca]